MSARERDPDLRRAVMGMLLAVPLWRWVFRSERGSFWTRMTVGGGALGVFALHSRREVRKALPAPGDLPIGLLSAGGLYVIFQIGDRLARRIMPAGSEDIAEVYRLRTLAPRPLILALLAGIIGPSEELFWRGLVQHALMRRFGRTKGTLAAAAAYGGVHLVTGNLTLTGAAGAAGLYWGGEYAVRPRLGPLLVSHVVWDVWIFLVAPTPGGRERTRDSTG